VRRNKDKLLVDTGASMTVLTSRYFNQIYRLAEFALDDFVINGFEISVIDYTASQSDGLLGMNFLSRFDFQLDQKARVLKLTPAN